MRTREYGKGYDQGYSDGLEDASLEDASKNNDLLSLLKEARKIIRASSSRNLVKDWDSRATQAIAAHGIKE
jgi:hypothetical protein